MAVSDSFIIQQQCIYTHHAIHLLGMPFHFWEAEVREVVPVPLNAPLNQPYTETDRNSVNRPSHNDAASPFFPAPISRTPSSNYSKPNIHYDYFLV